MEKPHELPHASPALPTVKAIYILAVTPKKMPVELLKSVLHVSDGILIQHNPAFARLMKEQTLPGTKIEAANIEYAGPIMHTPQALQFTLAGWIKKQYGVEYKPQVGVNFFPHALRDTAGKDNYFLYYFEMNA